MLIESYVLVKLTAAAIYGTVGATGLAVIKAQEKKEADKTKNDQKK